MKFIEVISVSHERQRDQARHWGARIACLIILPFLVYMAMFRIHFAILNHSGPGDSQMSSLFQANLVGNDFGKNPLGKRESFQSFIPLLLILLRRGCIWVKAHSQKHGLGGWTATLACADISGWFKPTASDLLPLQGREQ